MSKHITPLVFGMFISGFVIAGNDIPTSVVMQTVPIDVVWVADGTTLYRLDIWFDATSYPEPISAVDWRIEFPDYIDFDNSVSPSEEDFFFGNLPLDPFTDPAWQVTSTSVSGRVLVDNVPDAPIGASGIAASYLFRVDPSAITGQHAFDVPFVLLAVYNPDLNLCPPFPICSGLIGNIENFRFEIVGLSPADITGPRGAPDGCVDSFDLNMVLAAWCSALGGNPCGTCGP